MVLVGAELILLAKALPLERQIVGIDLAEGMIVLASQRLSKYSRRYF